MHGLGEGRGPRFLDIAYLDRLEMTGQPAWSKVSAGFTVTGFVYWLWDWLGVRHAEVTCLSLYLEPTLALPVRGVR